jgi:TRAP-type C4-dicarboxylate transport system permease small subunit
MALLAMAFLPIAEAAMRLVFGIGIPGSFPFVQHLTLWVTFLGAALAAREGKLLSMATGEFLPEGLWRTTARIYAAAVGAGVSIMLCRASIDLVVIERQAGTEVAVGLPDSAASDVASRPTLVG